MLLFDEHFSEQLVRLLADLHPGSLHARTLGSGGASDDLIWRLAQEKGLALVTRDEDFHRLSLQRGAPPKLIWVRKGNAPTSEVAALFRENHQAIGVFGL